MIVLTQSDNNQQIYKWKLINKNMTIKTKTTLASLILASALAFPMQSNAQEAKQPTIEINLPEGSYSQTFDNKGKLIQTSTTTYMGELGCTLKLDFNKKLGAMTPSYIERFQNLKETQTTPKNTCNSSYELSQQFK